MRLLTDDDVRALLSPAMAVAAMERAFRLQAQGALAAPPRSSIPSAGGRLVLTVGGAMDAHGATGFRAYHTAEDAAEQLVALFDGSTGELRAVVVGTLLGPLRTAAINAVAIRALARGDARVLGVLGSGRQAAAHARAALAVRPFTSVRVFSPDPAHRRAFAQALATESGLDVVAEDGAEAVVRAADVLVTATGSHAPVLDPGWIRPGTHVNGVGPKGRGASELPPEVGRMAATIATDSLAQVDAYPTPFFLDAPDRHRMIGLERIVAGEAQGRRNADEVTLFCSTGLAGTEVLLAEALLAEVLLDESLPDRTLPDRTLAHQTLAHQTLADEAHPSRRVAPAGRPSPAVRLVPMSEEDVQALLRRNVPAYAADHVRAGNLRDADAVDSAWQQVRALLPEGAATPGHTLAHIEDAAGGERVGTVWTQLRDGAAGLELFVMDLWIDERHRRRGFASAAFAELERRATASGAVRLSLHVFGHNQRARRLYRELGFTEADLIMTKPVS